MNLFARLLLLTVFSTTVFAERIVIISDLNSSYGSTQYNSRISKAIEVIKQLSPDLVISAGDMVAGQRLPLLSKEEVDDMWSAFNKTVTDPLRAAGLEFIITPGNHDGSAQAKFALERERFRAQWQKYRPALALLEGSDWPRRYALWAGKVLVISIDGSNVGHLNVKDLTLLQNVLEREGQAAEHIIVVSHLPMWPFAQGREKEIVSDPVLPGLLSKYGVDFFISGHHHIFYPGVDSSGMLNLSTGALGGNNRKIVGQRSREPFSFVVLDTCAEGYRISAKKAPGFTEDVSFSSLPKEIRDRRAFLQRLDLSDICPGPE